MGPTFQSPRVFRGSIRNDSIRAVMSWDGANTGNVDELMGWSLEVLQQEAGSSSNHHFSGASC